VVWVGGGGGGAGGGGGGANGEQALHVRLSNCVRR